MAITRTAGAWASGSTTCAPGLPASPRAGDLHVIYIGSKPYSATNTLVKKIGYLFKYAINKIETIATTIKVFNNAGAVVDQKSTISDDATTFTRGVFGTGP